MMIYLDAAGWWLLQHPAVVVVVTVVIAGGLLASIAVRVRRGGERVCRLVDRPGQGWEDYPGGLGELAVASRVEGGWAAPAAVYRTGVGLDDELETAGEVARPNVVRPYVLNRVLSRESGEPDGAAVVSTAHAEVYVYDAEAAYVDEPSLAAVDELEQTRRLSWAVYGLAQAMPPAWGGRAPGGNGAGYAGRHHRPESGTVTW